MLTLAVAMSIPMLNGVTMRDCFVAHLNANHSIGAWVDGGTLICGMMSVTAEHVSP